jgi:hypothetical protein
MNLPGLGSSPAASVGYRLCGRKTRIGKIARFTDFLDWSIVRNVQRPASTVQGMWSPFDVMSKRLGANLRAGGLGRSLT